MATLARASTPIGSRLDRAAAHEAVRSLAESYGVELPPLDLSTDLSFTPAPVPRRASEPGSSQAEDISPTTLSDQLQSAALSDPLDSIVCSSKAQQVQATGVTAASPRQAVNTPSEAGSSVNAAKCAGQEVVGGPTEDAAATRQHGTVPDAEDIVTEESSWLVNPEFSSPEYLTEAEYLEYQMPLEQRIALLEEERDVLVDKLLATTEALHASEARNRQSQASASQVGALLDQLQELLRRAEVERDRAKLQLKRQRVSFTQVPGSAVGQLPYCMSAPVPTAQRPTVSTFAGSSTIGSSSEEGSAFAGDSSAGASVSAEGGDQPPVANELQQRKKHKSTSITEEHPMAVLQQSAQAAAGKVQSTDAAAVSENAPVAVVDTVGNAVQMQNSSDSNMGSSNVTWRRRSSSGGRAEPAVDLAALAPNTLQSPGSLESPVTLTPSTDEARPPVKSVISGFEALMRQRARAAAAKAAAARAAEAAAAAAAGGSGHVIGVVAAAIASREGACANADAETGGAAAQPATADGDVDSLGRVKSMAAALQAIAEAEAAAVAAEADVTAAEAAALEQQSAVPALPLLSEQLATFEGSDPTLLEASLPLTASCDNMVASGTAEATQQSLALKVPPIRVERVGSEEGRARAAAVACHAFVSGSLSGSEGPTPTAAALCNASPVGFRKDVLAADDAISESDAASDVTSASYAEVAARNSREWHVQSRRDKATSPSPTRSSRAAHCSTGGAAHLQHPTQQHEQQQHQRHQQARRCTVAAGSTIDYSTGAVNFSMGRSEAGVANSNSSSLGRCSFSSLPAQSSRDLSQAVGNVSSPKGNCSGAIAQKSSATGHGSSRLGTAVAAEPTAIAAAVAEAATIKQQQRQGHIYDPHMFEADKVCSAAEGMAAGAGTTQRHEAAAAEPAAGKTADIGSKQHKQKQNRQQQQRKVASGTRSVISAGTVATPTTEGVATPSAVPEPDAAADCVAEVRAEPQPHSAAASAAVKAPAPTKGGPATEQHSSGNGNSTPRSSSRKKSQGGQKHSSSVAKVAAAAPATKAAAAVGATAASADAKKCSSGDQQGLLVKAAVVVLLLLSGGLLWALLQSRSSGPGVSSAVRDVELQQELAAMQEKVARLERQLTAKEAQLASCGASDSARIDDEL